MRLMILGAGKYGREIEDVATQTGGYERIDFLDDYADSPRVVGKCADFARFIDDNTAFFVAFGDNDMRERWLKALFEAKADVVNIIHPTAYISPTARLGRGVAVLPKALVNSYCVIEDGCMVNSGAIIKADNRIPPKMKVEAGIVIERNTYR